MGNSSSPGALFLQLENPNVLAGEELTGVVHLLLNQQIKARSLSLEFKGEEYSQWYIVRREKVEKKAEQPRGRDIKQQQRGMKGNQERSRSRSCEQNKIKTEQETPDTYRVITETIRGYAQFQKQEQSLYNFGGKVKAGQYSFPFRIQVPANSPGSFNLEDWLTKASISYMLSVRITDQNAGIEESKMPINVSQALTTPIHSMADDVSANISTWCCSSKGKVKLKASFDKNAYVPGETAELVINVNNFQSQLDVLRLKGTLYRTLRLRNNFGLTYMNKVAVMSQIHEERIPAERVKEKCIRMQLPIQDTGDNIQPSVKGQLIECVYSINVYAEMDGFMMGCGETPQIERFMTIYPPQLPSTKPVEVPPNWHPIVRDLVRIAADQLSHLEFSAPSKK